MPATTGYPYTTDFYPLFDSNSWDNWPNPGTMIEGWVGDFAAEGLEYDGHSLYNGALIYLHAGRAFFAGRLYWYGPDWNTDEGGLAPTDLLTTPLPEAFRPVVDTDIVLFVESEQSDPVYFGTSITLTIHTDGTITVTPVDCILQSEWAHCYNVSGEASWPVASGASDIPGSWSAIPAPNSPWSSDAEQALHTNRAHLRGGFESSVPITAPFTYTNVFGSGSSIPISTSMPNPPGRSLRLLLLSELGRHYFFAIYNQGLVQMEPSRPDDICAVAETREGGVIKGEWEDIFSESGYDFWLTEAAGEFAATGGNNRVGYLYSEVSSSAWGAFVPLLYSVGDKALIVVRRSSAGDYYAIELLIANVSGTDTLQVRLIRVNGGTRTVILFIAAEPVSGLAPDGDAWHTSRVSLMVSEKSDGTHVLDWQYGSSSGTQIISSAIATTMARGKEGYAIGGLYPRKNSITYWEPWFADFPTNGETMDFEGIGWPIFYLPKNFYMIV